jgi:Family of unknown function (DUF6506)
MPLSRFAFIVKGPGYSACKEHTAEVSSELFTTYVVGVSNLPSAILAAQQLVLKGTQLIELCGAFSESEATEIRDQTENKIPIGVVAYGEEQTQELERLFGDEKT